MILVAGTIHVTDRDEFLARSREAIGLARAPAGCLDFVVAADPLEAGRVNVFERWADRASLEEFRGEGPDDGLRALITDAAVEEYEV